MTDTSSNPNVLSFTASVDDSIVDWLLNDRRESLDRLVRMGFRRSALLQRGRDLGLSEQFLKRCSVGNPSVALRNCLGCGERFLSIGMQNRMCPRCRHRT